jgi:hypothetical protein
LYADLDWLARVAQKYEFHKIDLILSKFRFHSGGLTGSTWNSKLPKALFRLNRKYGGRLFSTVGKRYMMLLLGRVPPIGFFLNRRIRKMDWTNSPGNGSFYVFGAALTGYACLQALRESKRQIIGFIDNFPPKGGEYCGLPVLRPEEFVRIASNDSARVVVATGGYPFTMRNQLKGLGWKGTVYSYSNQGNNR